MFDFDRMRRLLRQVPMRREAMERASAKACGGSAEITGIPGSSGSGDRFERDTITLMEVRRAYAETLEELERMRSELSPMIDLLDDAHERAVMRLRWLDGHSADQIADEEMIPMSRRTVYRCLRRAENKIQRM